MTLTKPFLDVVEAQKGLPYVWGSDGPYSFDCSGLIVFGLKAVGLLGEKEDKHSSALIAMGEALSLEEAYRTPGAFLYRPGHIAVSRGDGTTIEARNPELGVDIFDAVKGRGWTRASLLPAFKEEYTMTGRMASPAEGRVSSEYGYRRALSANIPAMLHAGIDIAPLRGKSRVPIYAAYAGTVIKAGRNVVPGRTGNGVFIRSPDGEYQYYGHLSRIDVKVGDKVALGEHIGLMGATGNVTGEHLHFEVWGRDEKTRNPRVDFNAHGVTPGSTTGQRRTTKVTQVNGFGKLGSFYPYRIDGEAGARTWAALQAFLKDRGHYDRAIDGKPGYYTYRGLQNYLRSGRYYDRAIDGVFGPWTVKALQAWLKRLKRYDRAIDGDFDEWTVKSLQSVLGGILA